jgi:N-acetylglucosaminyl-diphospho-decaprenol L-rhamnosyltransferase
MIDLSILIVNWNTRDLVMQCLQSLSDTADRIVQEPQDGIGLTFGPYRAEVIVVDNASTDKSASSVQQHFTWARLIENEVNTGFAPANNRAYQHSAGRYVLLLNSDTVVHGRAVETLIAFMDEHPRCGAGGAQLLNADGSLQPSCQPMLTPWREFWRLTFLDRVWQRATYDMRTWNVASPRQVETIKGACLIVRREALENGESLFDERYFMYTEEVDLCYRLTRAGRELYWIPLAKVTHLGEASSRQAYNAMYVQLYRSKVQFYRKFGGESQAQLFKRLVTIAYLPRLAIARIASLIKPAFAARTDTVNQLLSELPKM